MSTVSSGKKINVTEFHDVLKFCINVFLLLSFFLTMVQGLRFKSQIAQRLESSLCESSSQ